MGLDHKAFAFNTKKFDQELRGVIEEALTTNSCGGLKSYIVSNLDSLVDPYMGDPLDDRWEDMFKAHDVQEYGDYALTKFYSPKLESGLGEDWETVGMLLPPDEREFWPVLGTPVGTNDNFFDPGRLGSYFQTAAEVKESLNSLNLAENEIPTELYDSFEVFRDLLKQASDENLGLFVTF